MKYTTLLFLLIFIALPLLLGNSCGSAPPPPVEAPEIALTDEEAPEEAESEPFFTITPPGVDLPVSGFREIWAYVVAGEEATLKPGMHITDVGYFGAEVNLYGTLVSVPNRRSLPAFTGKVHLVVSCNGRALSYFSLRSGSPERRALIADILAASRNYDGLQINFEYIPQRSGEDYFTFLSELKAGLESGTMFTVALAARTRKIADDVYDYERILPLVDRILVMAYDEHWSTSAPGAVASLAWCRNVARYSMNVIGREKLVMGIPLYGRTWSRPNHARALYYSGIQRTIRENNVTEIGREEGIPMFNYSTQVSVTGYYDDEYSLSARMEMYRDMGIDAVGFWRLGMETPSLWNILKIEKFGGKK